MEYSDSFLDEFLPRELPPEELIPSDAKIIFPMLKGDNDERAFLLQRSWAWTYSILREISLGQFSLDPNLYPPWESPFHQLAFGYNLSVGLFARNSQPLGFGLIVDDMNTQYDPFFYDDAIKVKLPRLNKSFPVVLRSSIIELHAPNPQTGTSACYGRCNNTNQWAIVTAGHVVSSVLASGIINLASGGVAHLIKIYHPPIDAALLSISDIPNNPSPLSIFALPTSGMNVDVRTQSNKQMRNITEVSMPYGILNTRNHAVSFCMDRPCNAGDSGALVADMHGRAVGIYSGALKHPSYNSRLGLVQNFEQARLALNFKPFV